MTQGRKHMTVPALSCGLALLAGVALFAPAVAPAQSPAEGEYVNPDELPSPDSDTQSDSEGAIVPGSGSGSDPTSGAPGTDGGGGAPILLIALAAIAAVCTGLAVWRLRRMQSSEPPADVSHGATGAASVTSETQSL